MALKIWKEGTEPLVAASIVSIFALLPHASQFVDPLVKTCIKLEAVLPAYKARFCFSPFRRPLARYLNRHAQQAISFFFPRLKTPLYSEILQNILGFDECSSLRLYLSNKQSSVMILNFCFERPLAIIRSEKSLQQGASGKLSLLSHGIGLHSATGDSGNDGSKTKMMTFESLELQHEGFRLVQTLLANDPTYFKDHNDIVRAFRWLWRSKGRFLRLQHEDQVPPRFHSESKMLASFLMSYGKSFPNEDLDILFELIRVFLQPSTIDFNFVSRFLKDMVSHVLNLKQKQQVMQRFFALLAGESSEETKVLSIQFLVHPMLLAYFTSNENRMHGETNTQTSDVGGNGLIDEAVVTKFVKEILFHNGNPIGCGDRLRVELLRLSNLFVKHSPEIVEPVRKDIVRFCWGLLKSEDSSCKGWAYLVVCRFIAAFETPVKIVTQVYTALLRSHQQEGKELFRGALDVLVPALEKRLSLEEFRTAIEQASKMMLEDVNSTPQVAHICQLVVRHPSVFTPCRTRLAGYMLNSLNRLGLPPNCPAEIRNLTVCMVELLLQWEEQASKNDFVIFSNEQIESLADFLIRLKILMAEPLEGRPARQETGGSGLDKRVTELLARVVSRSDCVIRPQPFEKVASKESKSPALLSSCLEIITVLLSARYESFFRDNAEHLSDLVAASFQCAKDDSRLRRLLRILVTKSTSLHCIILTAMVSLEHVIIETYTDCRKNSRGSDGNSRQTTRSRDRQASPDTSQIVSDFSIFAVELVGDICRQKSENLKLVESSLLDLANILCKGHVLEASAKQRHGAPTASRMSSAGIFYHSPTVGVIENAILVAHADALRGSQQKPKSTKSDHELTPPLRCLLLILSIFEESDIAYQFTNSRRTLVQIFSSLLDSSDNVQLLMCATRSISKWLLHRELGSPLTAKERSSLLWKLSSFDFNGLSDDTAAQPLSDMVSTCVYHLSTSAVEIFRESDDSVLKRAVVACLLSPNEELRIKLFDVLLGTGKADETSFLQLLWRMLHSDFEGLGGRFWVVLIVEALIQPLSCANPDCVTAFCSLVHGDVATCQLLLDLLLPTSWVSIPDDGTRLQVVESLEFLLSRPYHTQFMRDELSTCPPPHTANAVRSLLKAMGLLNPSPVIDSHLLVYLAENFNAWHETLFILESQYKSFASEARGKEVLSAIRHCYRQLGETNLLLSIAQESCGLPGSIQALSLDLYGRVTEAAGAYAELMTSVGVTQANISHPTDFEMDMWEERWIELQKELGQVEVVAEFANHSTSSHLQLECAWKARDWDKVRSLCSSPAFLAAIESGDPIVKISETLLAVADGKLSDVENLHAQTAQLCLYKWQLLPSLGGSPCHSSLLHFFHRLVEIRESGQIMLETSNHANGRTLPDLKNLLSAWRHRLPNDYESMILWDEIFTWRAHMFSAITQKFQSVCEPNTLATLHDKPWISIRMAKAARKQGLRDVSLLLLNRAAEERAMNVSDAFLKLREQVGPGQATQTIVLNSTSSRTNTSFVLQILAYFNPESDVERHGGLNLINTTNLSFFDAPQKSELFRMKAMFLASLGGRSKANQAYCHSVQICPSDSRAW